MNEEPLPPWHHRARRIAIRCAFVLGAFLVLWALVAIAAWLMITQEDQTSQEPSAMNRVAWALGATLAIVLQGAVCLLVIYGIIKLVRLCRPRKKQVDKDASH